MGAGGNVSDKIGGGGAAAIIGRNNDTRLGMLEGLGRPLRPNRGSCTAREITRSRVGVQERRLHVQRRLLTIIRLPFLFGLCTGCCLINPCFASKMRRAS
jgi:hypothetical protein